MLSNVDYYLQCVRSYWVKALVSECSRASSCPNDFEALQSGFSYGLHSSYFRSLHAFHSLTLFLTDWAICMRPVYDVGGIETSSRLGEAHVHDHRDLDTAPDSHGSNTASGVE